MGFHYRVYDHSRPYFVTLTVVGWIDIFTRHNHKIAVVESLKFCQEKKGLELFSWCLMSNHLHLIILSKDKDKLPDIIRDFKRFTTRTIIKQIKDEPESRREWLLRSFRNAAAAHAKSEDYKMWQDGFHPIELYTDKFTKQKLNYIHQNPVKEMLVQHSYEYMFSSAKNYAGLDGLLEVSKIE